MTATAELQTLYTQLSQLPNLHPQAHTNSLFTRLVELVLRTPNLTGSPAQDSAPLHEICAKGEYELEKYWAMRVCQAEKAWHTLQTFPYYINYERLVALEWSALATPSPNSDVLFCGGGPLPLTAILLAQRYRMICTILDQEPEAVRIATTLLRRLGLHDRIRYLSSSIAEYQAFNAYDVIYLAALTGVTEKEQRQNISHIYTKARPETRVILRSSWGSRTLLYKPLMSDLDGWYKRIAEIHPLNDIVNSVVILQGYAS